MVVPLTLSSLKPSLVPVRPPPWIPANPGVAVEQGSEGVGQRPSLPLTLLLFPPLELQHHIVVAHKGVDWGVQVKDVPQEKAILPPKLRNHHSH